MTAPLISERVRCAGCAAETSQATLDAAPTTMGWVEHDGFRLCADCAPSAKYIVALDRERNAHQVTLGKLEQLRERTITEERVREVVRAAINHEEVLAGHPAIVTIADLAAKELAGAPVAVMDTADRASLEWAREFIDVHAMPDNAAAWRMLGLIDRLLLTAAFDRESATVIDRALDLYSRTVLPAAELEVIARIRAALTGPVPS